MTTENDRDSEAVVGETRGTEDLSRRNLVVNLLGFAAGGLALEALSGCARGKPGAEQVAAIQAAYSGTGSLWYADSVDELRALWTELGSFAVLTGYSAPGDGGGGVFYWSATGSDDGGTVFAASTNGYWHRIYSGAINVRWFGATGDGSTPDEAALTAAEQAASAATPPQALLLPLGPPLPASPGSNTGTYKVSSALTLSSPLVFEPGALVRPESGCTVTIAGQYDARDTQQCFDVSKLDPVNDQFLITHSQTVSVCHFGAVAGPIGSSAPLPDSSKAFEFWAAAICDDGHALIPPGHYKHGGAAVFNASNITITAHGARIACDSAIDGNVAFDLNGGAQADGTGLQYNVRWFGGRLDYTGTAAGQQGIRVRVISRGCIEHVFGYQFSQAFITFTPRDAFTIRDCHGGSNGRHVWIEDWMTNLSNPQTYTIADCAFGTQDVAGIQCDAAPNVLRIMNNSFVNATNTTEKSTAIKLASGNGAQPGLHTLISGNTFEQGDSTKYYIVVLDSGINLQNLQIVANDFDVPTANCIQLARVTDAEIRGNRFVSKIPGFIALDKTCTRISIGPNYYYGYQSFEPGVSLGGTGDVNRNEIRIEPAIMQADVRQLDGWNGSGRSSTDSGGGLLDMSAISGSNWSATPETRLVPPRMWLLNIRARDSGSSTAPASLLLKKAGSSSNIAMELNLQGVPDDVWRGWTGWVPADDSGDIYYELVSSGPFTLDVYIGVLGWAYNGAA